MKHAMFMDGRFLSLYLTHSGYVIKDLRREVEKKKGKKMARAQKASFSIVCVCVQTNHWLMLFNCTGNISIQPETLKLLSC